VRGYLVLAFVFVLGAAAGGGGAFAWHEQRQAAMFRDRGGPDFEGHRLHGLARRLDLDAAQQDKIRAILTDDRDESRALGRDMFDRCGQPLRDHKAKVDAAIRAVLRPDQQARYDALVEERREHMWLGPPR